MPRTGLFMLLAMAYAITLIVTVPARLLGAWVGSRTHGVVELAAMRGTIWHGSAVPVFYAAGAGPVSSGRINWRLSLAPAARGKIGLLVRNDLPAPTEAAEIDIGPREIELRHAAFELPAALLEEIHPLLRAVEPQGTLQFRSDHLVVAGHALEGAAVVKWLSAGASVSPVNPFGSYSINLDGMGGKLAIRLTTISGPLLLEGRGDWSAAKGLAFQASARAEAGSQDALAELLHHLGPESAPGTRLIRIGQAI